MTTIHQHQGPADQAWGYPFGCDGLWSTSQVCDFLGGISADTLDRIVEEGRIRKGKKPDGRMVAFCARSVKDYVRSWEE